MSYGRRPYYIWSDGKTMNIDTHLGIPEEAINQFLYKILLSHNREDLKERLLEGRALVGNGQGQDDWHTDREDSVIRKLMDLK